jgi:hypothetical protein
MVWLCSLMHVGAWWAQALVLFGRMRRGWAWHVLERCGWACPGGLRQTSSVCQKWHTLFDFKIALPLLNLFDLF